MWPCLIQENSRDSQDQRLFTLDAWSSPVSLFKSHFCGISQSRSRNSQKKEVRSLELSFCIIILQTGIFMKFWVFIRAVTLTCCPLTHKNHHHSSLFMKIFKISFQQNKQLRNLTYYCYLSSWNSPLTF